MSKDKRKKFNRAMQFIRDLNYRGYRIVDASAMKRSGKLRFVKWMTKRGLISLHRTRPLGRGTNARKTVMHTGHWENF